MVYEKLVEEYHRLMSEEQNTLLIYKSRLGRAINALSNKEQEVMEIYKQYKCLLNNPKNLFVKYTIFKEVSFASFEEFKESLVKVKGKVEEVAQKISLPEDITVYWLFSKHRKENQLVLTQTQDQQEIILIKDRYAFGENLSIHASSSLTIVVVDAIEKEKRKSI